MTSLAAPYLALVLLSTMALRVEPMRKPGRQGLTPLSRFRSKEEAIAAFSAVEKSLRLKSSAKTADSELRRLFNSWKAQYNVSYPTEEEESRLRIFRVNVESVISDNRNHSHTHWAGLNALSALTFQEKLLRLTTRRPVPPRPKRAPVAALKGLTLTPRVDWRERGVVTPVKDQGWCGSCWIFAGVASMESKALIQQGWTYSQYPIDLSEQQIVSCANSKVQYDGRSSAHFTGAGCDGGLEWQVFEYVARWGIATEYDYPYFSGADWNTGVCNNALLARAPKLRLSNQGGWTPGFGGFRFIQQHSEQALKEAVSAQPVMVAWNVDNAFFNYQGGVYRGVECTTAPSALNHLMLVVGYDTTGPEPHWILKNGYGESWGVQGYIQVAMAGNGDGVCGMLQEGLYPTRVTALPRLPNMPKRRGPNANRRWS